MPHVPICPEAQTATVWWTEARTERTARANPEVYMFETATRKCYPDKLGEGPAWRSTIFTAAFIRSMT